jgi:hypothetical protein
MSASLEKARQAVPRFPIWPRLPEHRLLVLLDALVDCLQAGQGLQFFRGPWACRCSELLSLLEIFSERSAKIAIEQLILRFNAEAPSAGMFLMGQEEPAESAERTQLEVEFVETALPELVSALERVAVIVASAPAENVAENRAHWIHQKYRLCSSDGAVLEFDAHVGYPRFVRDGDGVGWWGISIGIHTLPPSTVVGERSQLAAFAVAASTLAGEFDGMLRAGGQLWFLASFDGDWTQIARSDLKSWRF